jgi:antitoxin ParD1/3/4
METEKLSISLPKDMAQMIRRTVERGGYASNSEVIRDAVRLWERREKERAERFESIRASINDAAASPKRITDDELGRHFDNRLAEAVKKQAS